MDVPVRLAFLAEIVQAEARHLRATDARLFSEPMTPQRAASWLFNQPRST